MNGKHKEILKTLGVKLISTITTAAAVVGILAALHLLPTDFVSKTEFDEYKMSHDKWAIARIEVFQNQIDDLKAQVMLLRNENRETREAVIRMEDKLDRFLAARYSPRMR